MTLQADWKSIKDAFDAKWPEAAGEGKPELAPIGDDYIARINTPDGGMSVQAGTPGAALAALALDISGSDRTALQARMRRENAQRRKDKADADAQAAQDELDTMDAE